ncbi:MFS transporter [Sporolactobacillus laevolacticus DSM 442]|uniref:MFS transporter n=2 Tax=Sporolactobacillus laevolacticus TaxID=33018 RepID=V6J1W3_9BACL|nr:MFS transporter [Sporolactobacillus laevolacticus]EST10739.1 MFS transporter [Sporolactobacillus laevolacticus DSM 442]
MSPFTKTEKSWIMYDWANSVYATIIMSAIFPIYFAAVAKSNGIAGDVWWGYATSASSLIIALTAPFLGALGDFKGMKKRLFTFALLFGAFFTAFMAFTDQPMLMLFGYSLSFIGFEGTSLFYDSFLTDVTTRERMNRVSAYGYAMGYLGGSTIPFLISIGLILFGRFIGVNGTLAVKISVVLTVLWWLGFSLPLLRNVHQTHYINIPKSKLVQNAFTNLKHTISAIIHDRKLLFFMIAYFFYIDGVGTVISMSTSYGSTLGLSSSLMILALLMTQLLAVPFSILFGRLSERWGTHRMLQGGVLVYMLICLLGFYLGFSLEPHQKAYENGFTQVVNQSSAQLDQQTLDSIKKNGISILSDADRVNAFDQQINTLANTRGKTEKAELEQLRVNVDAFLSDQTRAQDYTDAIRFSTVLFWILAVLVSTCQGGIQALSRAFFAKMIPANRSNEFFGFYDIFGKFAAVIGPALYAFSAAATGRSSFGILSLLLIFAIGFVSLTLSKVHFQSQPSTEVEEL